MVNLLLCIHCHQPVGNFPSVFQEAYAKAYLPFIETLERHPKIRISIHYSGSLLDWLAENQPEFLRRIGKLVKNSQIEIIAGGYYEPILVLIPEQDALAQIKMHKEKIEEIFSFAPKGIWLTERIWEPKMPEILSKAGIDFTIIDDSHFKLVGKDPEKLDGFYVSEEQGYKLSIFPGSEKLRYNIPFKLPQETIDYLKSRDTQNEVTITYGDDGEKFGLWPGTYKWVHTENWLEIFFSKLEENSDWINCMTFNEYLRTHESTGRIYLTCASYREMMEWSDGFYRNFFVKYPEANAMHKKMLYISNKINELDSEMSAKSDKEASVESIARAKQQLYKGQANDAYWHGVFGGLYLNHLRSAVYKNLIESEKIVDNIIYNDTYTKSEFNDFDCDGKEEIIINTRNQNLIFKPFEGGTVSFWAFKPKSVNLINTLARRHEPYHAKLKEPAFSVTGVSSDTQPKSIHDIASVKEKGLGDLLFYDRYPRYCLLDHFLSPNSTLGDFLSNDFRETGKFINKFYNSQINQKRNDMQLVLSSIGEVDDCSIKLTKKINVKDNGLVLDYKIENLQPKKRLSTIFGVEFNFSVFDSSLNGEGELKEVKDFKINDIWNQLNIQCKFDRKVNIWYFPVETISDSESGMERTYQQLSILVWSSMQLDASKVWENSFRINFG